MKIPVSKIVQSMIPVIVIISLFSCSKDTDLLADYVVSDFQKAQLIGNLAIGDNFVVAPQESIVLDVLANDIFINPDKVKIVETSQPDNGTVIINEDKTLTYYLDSADAPDTTVDSEVQDSSTNLEDNPADEEANSPPQTETGEEISQEEETIEISEEEEEDNDEEASQLEATEETPKQEESEQQQQDETTAETVEEKETVTEDFTYTVESTDEDNNKTIQEATVTVTTDLGNLKAFPEAEGYGKNATGGRGGFVYHVTNLGDSGPGSLRHGVEKVKGTRTIVFDVSGNISLSKPLKVRKGYGNLTIAGQTAPEDGITLKGSSFWIHDSNLIIRYLRIRPGKDWLPAGDYDFKSNDYEPDDAVKIVAWSGTTIRNIILDHCSISWGRDGLVDVTGAKNGYVKNISIQNNIIAENVDKGFGTLINKNVADITFFKNLYAHNKERNILYKNRDQNLQFINNIIYNFKRGTNPFYNTQSDIIGNVYMTNATSQREIETIRLGSSDEPIEGTRLYNHDNTEDGGPISISTSSKHDLRPYLVNSAICDNGLEPLPNSDVMNEVLSVAGASLSRDEADNRIIHDVINKTGARISHENQVGGFPILESSSRPYDYDTDYDGIADQWEIANNLDPKNPNDGNEDANGDGYTNLESFLYSLTQ